MDDIRCQTLLGPNGRRGACTCTDRCQSFLHRMGVNKGPTARAAPLSSRGENKEYSAEYRAATADGQRQMLLNYLERISSGECGHDIHLESQSMSLATPIFNGNMLPIDFIGDLANLPDDFALMLRLAGNKTGVVLGAEELQRAQTLLGSLAGTSQHHTDRIEEELEKLRSAELDERVLRTYAQDVACFSQSSEGS